MGGGPGKSRRRQPGRLGRAGSGLTRLRPAGLGLVFAIIALATSATACADERGGSERESQVSAGRGGPKLVTVAEFNRPVEVKSAPGFPRLMFVVEQEGRVRVLRRGRRLARPFLDIRGRVESGGERGLLSIAFPPGYRKSKRFYVYYTDSTGDIRVDEFRRRTAVRARRNSGRRVITIPHRDNANHNGGQLHFLGNNLYFGTGDGGGAGDTEGNSQDLGSLLGKMIRIDPRKRGGRPYSVPDSNPFVGRPGRNEIFAYGLRNPFRWSFDLRGSGKTRMLIADVGQDRFEEINDLPLGRARGANFGWNAFEGFSDFAGSPIPGTIKPKLVLRHPEACSVIGGLVVDDRKVPALRGRYIFTDLCDSRIRRFRPGSGRVKSPGSTGLTVPQISSFGANRRGTVFMTTLQGSLLRLTQ